VLSFVSILIMPALCIGWEESIPINIVIGTQCFRLWCYHINGTLWLNFLQWISLGQMSMHCRCTPSRPMCESCGKIETQDHYDNHLVVNKKKKQSSRNLWRRKNCTIIFHVFFAILLLALC
jgi:hypothetical protein